MVIVPRSDEIGERIDVRLGDWRPPDPYDYPQLEPESSIRTQEHDVLADVTVVQRLGEEAETFTLRGDAYDLDIAILRDMRGEEVELRHPIHIGEVLVKSVRATSTGSWDEDIYNSRDWVYNYTVELVSVL